MPAGITVAILVLWKEDGFSRALICTFFISIQTQLLYFENFEIPNVLVISVVAAFGHVIPYWLALKIYDWNTYYLRGSQNQELITPIVWPFYLLLAAMGAATLGVAVQVALASMNYDVGRSIWTSWWVGDYVGAIVLAPFFIVLGTRLLSRWVEPRTSSVLVAYSTEGSLLPTSPLSWLAWVLLVLIPSVIAVVRSEIYAGTPVLLALFFVLLPLGILAMKEAWATMAVSVAASSLMLVLTVREYGVSEAAIANQTSLITIAIASFAFFHFLTVYSVRTKQLAVVEESSRTDPLTKTLNRIGLIEFYLMLCARFSREKQPFSLLILDIDDFKLVNDQFGHRVGDQTLVQLTRLIKDNIRKADALGRWGGEEFIVLLANLGENDAYEVAEQIRKKVAEEVIESSEGALSISVSIGVKEYKSGMLLTEIAEGADKALMIAKSTGKNAVFASSSLT